MTEPEIVATLSMTTSSIVNATNRIGKILDSKKPTEKTIQLQKQLEKITKKYK